MLVVGRDGPDHKRKGIGEAPVDTADKPSAGRQGERLADVLVVFKAVVDQARHLLPDAAEHGPKAPRVHREASIFYRLLRELRILIRSGLDKLYIGAAARVLHDRTDKLRIKPVEGVGRARQVDLAVTEGGTRYHVLPEIEADLAGLVDPDMAHVSDADDRIWLSRRAEVDEPAAMHPKRGVSLRVGADPVHDLQEGWQGRLLHDLEGRGGDDEGVVGPGERVHGDLRPDGPRRRLTKLHAS